MSSNATDDRDSASPSLRATVDFPDPEPPAIPITNGFTSDVIADSAAFLASDVRATAAEREAA